MKRDVAERFADSIRRAGVDVRVAKAVPFDPASPSYYFVDIGFMAQSVSGTFAVNNATHFDAVATFLESIGLSA